MEINLQLPNDIYAIKLKDYQKYLKLIDNNKDAEKEFFDIKLMEIFAGLKYKDIEGLPVDVFEDAIEYVEDVFQEKTPLTRRFKMEGSDGAIVEFGFIPNMDKMTMGEYIDLNTYFEDFDNLHKAMAVLYRPIHPDYKNKDSYKIDSYKGTEAFSDLMKDMPLGIALGARVFFYRLGIKLSKLILSSSQQLLLVDNNLSEEEKQTLMKNMDGIESYMQLQEEMLLKLMKLR